MFKIIFSLASFLSVRAYTGGATNCQNPGHGTFVSSVPSDWTLSLLDAGGNSVTQWSAGQTYTAQIRATSTSFKGWSWAPLKGVPASFPAGSSSMAGSFAAGDSYSHVNTGCPGSITQSSGGTSRTTIKAAWTPPAAGTGTVSLWSMMIISKNGNNYNAVLTVNEAPATTTNSKGASPSPTGTLTGTPAAHTSASAVPIANANTIPVTSTASAYMSMLAVGLGSAMAAAIVVAIAAVVVTTIRPRAKKIFYALPPHVPTVMRVSPIQEAEAQIV